MQYAPGCALTGLTSPNHFPPWLSGARTAAPSRGVGIADWPTRQRTRFHRGLLSLAHVP
jgi:hypothetical protein